MFRACPALPTRCLHAQVWLCEACHVPNKDFEDGLQAGELASVKVFRAAHRDKELMRLALREVRRANGPAADELAWDRVGCAKELTKPVTRRSACSNP